MKKISLLKSSLFCTMLLLAFACTKREFDYIDGTPGDGADTVSITVDTSVKKIDVSKYAQARVFPGLVCGTEPRLNNVTVNMNLNYNFVGDDLRISVPPAAQFSTGFYAAPGELVIIDAPATDYSLSVQVGAWVDNLTNVENPPRDPIIYSRMQLAPGRNYVRNLYGGHIYIYAGRPIAAPVPIVFSNVVHSPDFVLGETSNAAWVGDIRKSCVPFLELRSKNAIFVVPRDYCIIRNITDPAAIMTAWDNIIDLDYYQWQGLSVSPADPVDKAPILPWRVVQDIRPSVGYGHSGYPVVTYNDLRWFDEFTNLADIIKGSAWGTLHEIGHNNQQGRYWSWSTLGETTNNLFAFKVAHRLTNASATADALPERMPLALAFAAEDNSAKSFDGADSRINDPFARLTPFVQIFDKIPANWGYAGQPDGWAFMGELYKKTRRATRISLTDIDKHDFVYEAICEFTHKDWRLFFSAWGITVSSISQNKMGALYPLMTQEIWKYNPLTKTGGNTLYDPYSKSGWVVTVSSVNAEGGGNGINVLVDGVASTYWHSAYDVAMPHIITVDMGKQLDIKGFSFLQRQNLNRNIKNLKVETSTDGTTWTPVTGSPFLLQRIAAEQFYTLPTTINVRYFKLSVLAQPDTYNAGTGADNNNTSLAEVSIIKP